MNNICKKNADNNYDIPEYSTFFSYIENDIEETRMLVNALKISDEIKNKDMNDKNLSKGEK